MITPKILLFILIFLYPINQGLAQITINGNVRDNEFYPVNNALVQILDEANKSNFYSAYTDQNGYFSVHILLSGVSNERSKIPDNIVLKNYPNPFNPSTVIYYELPSSGNIEMEIYDILGRKIRSLYTGFQTAGIHQLTWDGGNNSGFPVAAGIYLCRLSTKNHFRVNKMVLLDGGSFTLASNNVAIIKSPQNKIPKQTDFFRFTIKVSEKYINPIEIKNITCSGDTTLNLTATKPLVKIIGPEGGLLSNDEFYLSIPSSAFKVETELRLYTIPVQVFTYEEVVSKTYRLEGIPPDYNHMLRVGLKYEGNIKNQSILEFGKIYFIPEISDSIITYSQSAAFDSAGFLWADYPNFVISENNKVSKTFEKIKSNHKIVINNPYAIYVKARSNTKRMETENFYGYLPEFAWNTPILNYLESAYTQYKNMGFTFQPDNIPVSGNKCNVIIHYVDRYSRGPEEGNIFGTGQAYISREPNNYDKFYRAVNLDFFWWLFLDDYPYKNRLQAISGIVLFDAISQIYDTKKEFDRRARENNRLWFHKAVSFWAGELFAAEENYIPPGFSNNELSPFHGMVSGAGTTDEKQALFHGYGMTSLIKYLMDKAEYEGISNTFLHDVYSKIFEDDHPAAALIKIMKMPPEVWWPEYLKEYISGNIYNVPASIFLNAGEDDLLKVEIKDNTEFNAGFLREYKDFSAKLFRIDLNYTETKVNNQLEFKPEYEITNLTDAATLLFGLKNEKLEFLNGGIGTVSCNIKNVQDQGYNTLLAAVVNNYFDPTSFDSYSNINLNIKLKEKDTINYTIVKVSARGKLQYYDGSISDAIYLYNPGSGTARYGTFNNGIFESKWLESFYQGCEKGSIKLVVDLNSFPPKITGYSVQESVITTYDKEENFIQGNNVNIPGYKRSFGGYEFYISGKEICGNITTLENNYWGQGGYSWSLTAPYCDGDSYIKIVLGGE